MELEIDFGTILHPGEIPLTAAGSETRGKVLVVDDDEAMRIFLEEALSDEGYQVTGAPDTLSALLHLLGKAVDVMVIDWKMPDLDGFSLLGSVRRCYPNLPVIFVTAFPRPEIQRRALEQGAFGFLGKPFPVGRLLSEIERALEARGRSRGSPPHSSPPEEI